MPTEGWESILDGQLAANEPRRTRRSVGVNYSPQVYPILVQAARVRGMSMSAYQRRAALAFAIMDLGLDWDAVMADEPAFGTFDSPTKAVQHGGQDFGAWKIRDVR